ncbi:hypothetical protein LUPAC06_00831 [Micromonospora saelicesensis]|nr:hypothetical protein LUPAC06_00831 [Micromonospora saelicesensis]
MLAHHKVGVFGARHGGGVGQEPHRLGLVRGLRLLDLLRHRPVPVRRTDVHQHQRHVPQRRLVGAQTHGESGRLGPVHAHQHRTVHAHQHRTVQRDRLLVRADHQHRAVRVRGHLRADRAEQQPDEPAQATAAHHDQLRPAGLLDHGGPRAPEDLTHLDGEAGPPAGQLGRRALQHLLRLLGGRWNPEVVRVERHTVAGQMQVAVHQEQRSGPEHGGPRRVFGGDEAGRRSVHAHHDRSVHLRSLGSVRSLSTARPRRQGRTRRPRGGRRERGTAFRRPGGAGRSPAGCASGAAPRGSPSRAEHRRGRPGRVLRPR